MTIGKGSQIDWSNIESIYSKLNTERARFGFTSETVPEKQYSNAIPEDVTNLKDSIAEMSTHYRLTSVADADSITDPIQGELIETNPFDTIDTIISNINNTPTYGANYGYNSTYNGTNYGYNGTNYGFNNANNGYNNSNNTWNSGNFSYNNGNNGYNNSNNTWNSGNFGYNSSNK